VWKKYFGHIAFLFYFQLFWRRLILIYVIFQFNSILLLSIKTPITEQYNHMNMYIKKRRIFQCTWGVPGGSTHTSLSPIRRGFAPSFVNYKKGCTRFAAASDKAYQLLVHGRWFSPGIPVSFTTKISRHYIAKILLKVALNTINQIKSKYLMYVHVYIWHQCTMYFVPDLYALAFSVQSILCMLCTCTHLPWVYNVLCVRTCTHLPLGTMYFVYVHVHTYLRCTLYFCT
jgi:hypothetical protein